jgi:ABC-type glycerol-3-phosphate transport system permease component
VSPRPMPSTKRPPEVSCTVAATVASAHAIVDYPRLMACAMMTLLPCVILFFSFQRLYIQGVVVTGVDK